jgi:hypothetical protein
MRTLHITRKGEGTTIGFFATERFDESVENDIQAAYTAWFEDKKENMTAGEFMEIIWKTKKFSRWGMKKTLKKYPLEYEKMDNDNRRSR